MCKELVNERFIADFKLVMTERDNYLSGKSATIRESNHGSCIYKEHYALYYVPKSSILLAGTGVWKISSVACGFSSTKIDYTDCPKSEQNK